MNDLHEKLGSGLNKIQDSLQTNKQKFQNAQGINQHKRIIQEASLKRNEILLQLGEELYKKLRCNEIQSDELSNKVASLIDLDRSIFKAQQAITELNAYSTADHSCTSCGATITSDDKFCGSCGTKVELPEQAVVTETVPCQICEEQISVHAVFCNCCGTKVV
ncbi:MULTISPECIES: zinc ribbon domain-containing protein [Peribacillus]|uniref:zinc ribbon domain-containing protein n=1 Tax=Peribacillus TaxID=2675229 RepID=UPI00207AB65E|nr:zinc ribbon domain-containing protein [Peribacillus asahii]USK69667.1 zinc ribbon domain-containing protein [Peribacillus asahii]